MVNAGPPVRGHRRHRPPGTEPDVVERPETGVEEAAATMSLEVDEAISQAVPPDSRLQTPDFFPTGVQEDCGSASWAKMRSKTLWRRGTMSGSGPPASHWRRSTSARSMTG
jgi:hypothetical protein